MAESRNPAIPAALWHCRIRLWQKLLPYRPKLGKYLRRYPPQHWLNRLIQVSFNNTSPITDSKQVEMHIVLWAILKDKIIFFSPACLMIME
jgi:hypothetical protein